MKAMNEMIMRMCCYSCSKQMMHDEMERREQHIIYIYKERQQHEKISIPDSFVFRAAA